MQRVDAYRPVLGAVQCVVPLRYAVIRRRVHLIEFVQVDVVSPDSFARQEQDLPVNRVGDAECFVFAHVSDLLAFHCESLQRPF